MGRKQPALGKRELPSRRWFVVIKWDHHFIFLLVNMNSTDNSPDDAAVIRDVLKGQVNAFEILIDRYQEPVTRIVAKHLPREFVPEVTHDAFVRAYQSLGTFQGRGSFSHWLAKIAVRCCYDFWRDYYQRLEKPFDPLPDDCRTWVDHLLAGPSQDQDAERMEARDLLQWAMGKLSPAERMVLTLTHLNEYSGAEAAELLGWSVIRVKVQAHRARKKLRKILAKIFPQGIA